MIEFSKMKVGTDMIHGTICFSGLEDAVISTPIFNRLHRVLQSSMVYLTYPSNKVKRYEHCVGTMHLAGQILYNSVINTKDKALRDRLLKEADDELIAWSESAGPLKNILLSPGIRAIAPKGKPIQIDPPENALYRNYYPAGLGDASVDAVTDKNKAEEKEKRAKKQRENHYVWTVLFEGVRLAALLHDVGHLPYSHVFEYAAANLYARVKAIPDASKAQRDFLSIMTPYYEGGKHNKLHEKIGETLVTQIKAELAEELLDTTSEENLFTAAALYFAEKILKAKRTENSLFSDLHRIISGVVDADRLDYCSRDLFGCGIRKEAFPYGRLLSSYQMVEDDDTAKDGRKRIVFCPSLRMVREVESLLDRRWEIFSDVNYHHKVHKHEILFSEVLANIGFRELEELDQKQSKEPDEKPREKRMGIPGLKAGKPIDLKLYSIWSVVRDLQNEDEQIDYSVIQIDDGWMDTLLKQAFFKTYDVEYQSIKRYGNLEEWNMFDELISAKRHFLTLYKRSEAFREFDVKFAEDLLKALDEAWDTEGLNDYGKLIYKRVMDIVNKKSGPPAFAFQTAIDLMFHDDEAKKNGFYKEIETQLNTYLKEGGGNEETNVTYCLLRDCNPSLGCYDDAAPARFHSDGRQLVDIDTVSIKVAQLTQTRSWSLPFHLYYLPRCEGNNSGRRLTANESILEEKLRALALEEMVRRLKGGRRRRRKKAVAPLETTAPKPLKTPVRATTMPNAENVPTAAKKSKK